MTQDRYTARTATWPGLLLVIAIGFLTSLFVEPPPGAEVALGRMSWLT